jgi:hypothetical protein
MKLWLANLIALVLTALPQEQSRRATQEDLGKVYTVCDVLEHLKELNGTVIAVRGAINGGNHGTYVSSPLPCHIVVKGYIWPDDIWLENPTDAAGHRTESDPVGRERVRREIRRLRPSRRDQILVTYVGLLEAKDLAESVSLNRAGQLWGWGFGPGIDAPAQLTVKAAKDPVVIRRKAEDSEAPRTNH